MTPAELASAYAALLDSVLHDSKCDCYPDMMNLEGLCNCDRLQRQGELVRRMVEAALDATNELHRPAWTLAAIHGAHYTDEQMAANRASVYAAALAVRAAAPKEGEG